MNKTEGAVPPRRGTKGIDSKLPDSETLAGEIADARKRLNDAIEVLEGDPKDAAQANDAYDALKRVLAALAPQPPT